MKRHASSLRQAMIALALWSAPRAAVLAEPPWGGLPIRPPDASGPAREDSGPEVEALVVRLVHPERQAAAWIRLCEGARAHHPAWALAAWKRASGNPDVLGKPL